MGLQLLLAKLKILALVHGQSSLVTAMVWPFLLKLPFWRHMPRCYVNIAASLQLFSFQLRRIFFQDGPVRNDRSWERALRLIRERVTDARWHSAAQSDEDSLHELFLVSL